jgi:hypothetical protein
MTSRPRMSILAFGLFSFVLASGLARDAHAISIDNSVDVEWQNGRYLDEFATVTGGNFLVDSGDLDDVLINVLISGAPNDIEGFRLILYVGASLQDIEQNPAPTQLTLPVGDSFPNSVFPYEVTGSSYSLSVTLSQFQGYDLLPLLPTLAFSLDGTFRAKSSAGSGLPCDQLPPGTSCPSWPGSVSVSVTGGQPVATPEPSPYALLLIGGASVAALRRRRG